MLLGTARGRQRGEVQSNRVPISLLRVEKALYYGGCQAQEPRAEGRPPMDYPRWFAAVPWPYARPSLMRPREWG